MNDAERLAYAYEAINQLSRLMGGDIDPASLESGAARLARIIDQAVDQGWSSVARRRIGVSCVICHKHCVLMGWHNQRACWEFPGGAQAQNERLLITAHRETLEETGIMIPENAWKFVGWTDLHDGWLDMVYSVKVHDFIDVQPTSDGKHREWQWFANCKLPTPLNTMAQDIVKLKLFDLATVYWDDSV